MIRLKFCKVHCTLLSAATKHLAQNNFATFSSCFFCTLFNTAPTAAPQITLYRRILGSNTGQVWLCHWLSDALTIRLNRICLKINASFHCLSLIDFLTTHNRKPARLIWCYQLLSQITISCYCPFKVSFSHLAKEDGEETEAKMHKLPCSSFPL